MSVDWSSCGEEGETQVNTELAVGPNPRSISSKMVRIEFDMGNFPEESSRSMLHTLVANNTGNGVHVYLIINIIVKCVQNHSCHSPLPCLFWKNSFRGENKIKVNREK